MAVWRIRSAGRHRQTRDCLVLERVFRPFLLLHVNRYAGLEHALGGGGGAYDRRSVVVKGVVSEWRREAPAVRRCLRSVLEALLREVRSRRLVVWRARTASLNNREEPSCGCVVAVSRGRQRRRRRRARGRGRRRQAPHRAAPFGKAIAARAHDERRALARGHGPARHRRGVRRSRRRRQRRRRRGGARAARVARGARSRTRCGARAR